VLRGELRDALVDGARELLAHAGSVSSRSGWATARRLDVDAHAVHVLEPHVDVREHRRASFICLTLTSRVMVLAKQTEGSYCGRLRCATFAATSRFM